MIDFEINPFTLEANSSKQINFQVFLFENLTKSINETIKISNGSENHELILTIKQENSLTIKESKNNNFEEHPLSKITEEEE